MAHNWTFLTHCQRFNKNIEPMMVVLTEDLNVTVNVDGANDRHAMAIAPPDTQGDVGPNYYIQWLITNSDIIIKAEIICCAFSYI